MANTEHEALLKEGRDTWNRWRAENPAVIPDLSGANLARADLMYRDLRRADLTNVFGESTMFVSAQLDDANLTGAQFRWAYFDNAKMRKVDARRATFRNARLSGADLSGAMLAGAKFTNADFSMATLDGANLVGARLYRAQLIRTSLVSADLSECDLTYSVLVDTNLRGANLSGASVYGFSAWNLNLEDTDQSGLQIAPIDGPFITVDNLEIAQFIFLLANNKKLRDVITTITSKVVLILGRFTPERKRVLDGLREALRHSGYVPIMFDFDVPAGRNFTETVSTLAHLARFVIADLTSPRSVPHELQAVVPRLAVPVQLLVHSSESPYGMADDLRVYPWVLPTLVYDDEQTLLKSLNDKIIAPAEAKARQLAALKADAPA